MQFLLDHLEGFISATALVVSILGAVLGRYFTKNDMLKKQRADFNKELCYSFCDYIFEFLDLCLPEFADDILDSVLDEYQYDSNLSFKSRIDKAYVEISRRKQKLRMYTIKMEAYASSDIPKTEAVLVQVKKLCDCNMQLLDMYSRQLKDAFLNDNVNMIDSDALRGGTNQYEAHYSDMVEEIKKYVKEIKTQFLA